MKKYTKQWLLILALTLTCAGLSGCALLKEKRMSWTGPSQGTPIRQHFIPTTEISL